jgi:integrase
MSTKQRTRKTYVGRVYLGGGRKGRRYKWVGRFPTKKARDDAVAAARVELQRAAPSGDLTCSEWAERFLTRYRREHKESSYDAARSGLRRFLADFGDRLLRSINRPEAMDWADRVPPSSVPTVVTLFGAAVDAELIDRNPFRRLTHRSRGRSDHHPPTEDELSLLLDACSIHGWYAATMRSLITFAAYTGLRPGELFALEWSDVAFDAMRVHVRRRVYKGHVDLPKSGRTRTVAMPPLARDALLGLSRETTLVFTSKRGKRLSAPMLSGYWGKVTARADMDFDFYLATKHYAVHYLYVTLGLPPRVIAEQMGWTLAGVTKLLAVYGHGDVGALEEIDRAFATNVRRLRVLDAGETQKGGNPAP